MSAIFTGKVLKKLSKAAPLNVQAASSANSPFARYLPVDGDMARLYTEDQVLMTQGGSSQRALEIYMNLISDPVIAGPFGRQLSEIASRELIIDYQQTEREPITDEEREAGEFLLSQMHSLAKPELADELASDCLLLQGEANIDVAYKWLGMAKLTNYSPIEIVWKKDRKGRSVVDRLIMVDPRRMQFYQHIDGNIEARILNRFDSTDGQKLLPRKFMINRFWSNLYFDPLGSGLGPVLYWLTEWRRDALSFWLALAERHSDPSYVGETPQGASKPQLDKFEQDLSLFGRETNMVLPPGFKVTIPGSTGQANTGANLLKSLIEWTETQSSLVLTGEETTGRKTGGSQARETINNSIRIMEAAELAQNIEQTLNNSLCRWLLLANGFGRKRIRQPKIKRNWMSAEQILDIADKYKKLGLTADPDFISRATKVPLAQPKQKTKRPSIGELPGVPKGL